jgi:hypothetical protein
MRNARSLSTVFATCTAALALAALAPPVVVTLRAQSAPPLIDNRPDSATVKRAVQQVKADPNLATSRRARTLRWRGSESTGSESATRGSWLLRIAQAFAESTRFLFWAAAIAAALVSAAALVRAARTRQGATVTAIADTPAHVRDLDIRPGSLPDDVGAAASVLWSRGDQRAALALLYRGMLSRLVHVHRLPIRDSSTEGDCLRLAQRDLAPSPNGYVRTLVAVWQRSVYGRQMPDDESVRRLCGSFDRALSAGSGDATA